MTKPVLLDLFCGVGGAAYGYRQAGFHVVGVDHVDQWNYAGDEFIQDDALDFLRKNNRDFDCIHASPPCQAYSIARYLQETTSVHPDLVPQTRNILNRVGKKWIIENVPGSPVTPHLTLCGSMFGLHSQGAGLRRHRLFEFGYWSSDFPPLFCRHTVEVVCVFGNGGHRPNRPNQSRNNDLTSWKKAMGIDWVVDKAQISQAIPPAYTRYIGKFLVKTLLQRKG